jgi:hypothetical protein
MRSWIRATLAHLLRISSQALVPVANRRAINLLRLAILASSAAMMLPGAWGHSATAVEFAHIPAGLAAWQRHSLGIYRVCGPLSKLLYALPAYLAGVRVEYPNSFDSDVQSRSEWELGSIFQEQNRQSYHDIYRCSRLLPIFVMILGGWLICAWSTFLFGTSSGIVSLCVWCWMPPILAHGSLVTSDMLSAVLLLWAARSFWDFLVRPGAGTSILAGLTLGMASVAKFTLLVLYPCWALLLIGRWVRVRSDVMPGLDRRLLPRCRLLALGLATFVISVFIIDAVYLFQNVGFRLAQWQPTSSLAAQVRRLEST